MEDSNSLIIREANEKLIMEADLSAVGNYFAEGYKVHITNREIKGGHKIVRDILTELLASFSEIQFDLEFLVEAEDRVAWQRTYRAKHDKPYKGFPASGLDIVWRDMVTSRIEDGRIAEDWVITDLAEQLLLSRKKKS